MVKRKAKKINGALLKRAIQKQAKAYKKYKIAEKQYKQATGEVQRRLKTIRKIVRKK